MMYSRQSYALETLIIHSRNTNILSFDLYWPLVENELLVNRTASPVPSNALVSTYKNGDH